MKKSSEFDPLAPRPNLDYSKGVRGKYYERMQQGTNLVILDPALVPHFPDSESSTAPYTPSSRSATSSVRHQSSPTPKVRHRNFDPRTGITAKVSATR